MEERGSWEPAELDVMGERATVMNINIEVQPTAEPPTDPAQPPSAQPSSD